MLIKENLTNVYFSFLRIYKNKFFILKDNWDFLYSLETYRHQLEEFWIITNILSQTKNLKKILEFYMECRSTFHKVYNFDDLTILDDVDIEFNSLHLIFNSLYAEKATKKMHLIQNLKNNSKCKI